MKSCKTCKNAIFDPLWGLYKCGVLKRTMINPDAKELCRHYKEGTSTDSKQHEE